MEAGGARVVPFAHLGWKAVSLRLAQDQRALIWPTTLPKGVWSVCAGDRGNQLWNRGYFGRGGAIEDNRVFELVRLAKHAGGASRKTGTVFFPNGGNADQANQARESMRGLAKRYELVPHTSVGYGQKCLEWFFPEFYQRFRNAFENSHTTEFPCLPSPTSPVERALAG
jgi:hypothetical protein